MGPALECSQRPVRQPRTVGEAGLIKHSAQVLVTEDENGTVQCAKQERDRPEDVGRVACLHYGEPTRAPRAECQPGGRHERVDVLADEADLAATRSIGPVLVDLDGVNNLVTTIAITFRAHDRDLVTG